MAKLEIRSVEKSFGTTAVLHGIDLCVEGGEMMVIVGPSGCGKSTLLRIVAGLERPNAGQILIDGRDITPLEPADRDIAMVFQSYALYPHMTVFENMAYGLRIRRLPRAEIERRVREVAEMLAIGHLLGRRPRELSGGQRQRVAMGRAIVRHPKLFLFDEPLSNLDAKLRVQMRAEIRRLQKRLGVTSLFVTHDQVEAMTLGDRLMVMNEGRAAQIGTPLEIWTKPADTYVATFIGSPAMNLLPAQLTEGGTAARLRCGAIWRFADGLRCGEEGREVIIGIRPEHLHLDGAEGLPVAVELAEPLGSETVIHGRLDDGTPLTARLPGLATAEILHLAPHAAALHIFEAASGRRLGP